MKNTKWIRTGAISALSLTCVLLVSGCAVDAGDGGGPVATDGGEGGGTPNVISGITTIPELDEELAALVPDAIATKGVLTVGTDATMPPKEFVADDGTTVQGLDVDLTYAIGNVLGLKMTFVNTKFDSLLPGVQNGRYDFVASSAAPTAEREAQVDMVSVTRSGESLLIRAEDEDTITSLEDTCGLKVGAPQGSLQLEDIAIQSEQCEAAGEPAIDAQVFPDAAAANQALVSGRIAASFLDLPGAVYRADASEGTLLAVGPVYRAGLEAYFMQQGNGLADPVSKAVNLLIENGTYAELLKKWSLESGKLEVSYVNPITTGKDQ
jgi:polar amino acid transport system substrate-binding protein